MSEELMRELAYEFRVIDEDLRAQFTAFEGEFRRLQHRIMELELIARERERAKLEWLQGKLKNGGTA